MGVDVGNLLVTNKNEVLSAVKNVPTVENTLPVRDILPLKEHEPPVKCVLPEEDTTPIKEHEPPIKCAVPEVDEIPPKECASPVGCVLPEADIPDLCVSQVENVPLLEDMTSDKLTTSEQSVPLLADIPKMKLEIGEEELIPMNIETPTRIYCSVTHSAESLKLLHKTLASYVTTAESCRPTVLNQIVLAKSTGELSNGGKELCL